MDCINCGTTVTTKYCPNCGQLTTVKRLTLRESWFDFWSKVYGFDGLFTRTIRDLTLRPGLATRKFIEGNRVLYYGPVSYFFLMITLYLLVLSMLGFDMLDFMKGTQASMQVEGSDSRLTKEMQRLIAENIKLFIFFVIPFQAFTARYLLFRKSGYNFLENTVLPFYTFGHLNWISILMAIGFKLTGSPFLGPAGDGSFFVAISFTASILYIGFSYSSFMTYQSRVKAFFKGIALYFISYFLFMIAFTIIMVVVVLSLKYLSPETFELIKPSKN